MENSKPLNNNVIVRRDEKPEFTDSGIALPETQYVAPNWVTVLAAPTKTKDRFGERDIDLTKGDRAFVRPSAGYKNWQLDKNLQVCHHSDVVALDRGAVEPYDHYVMIKKPERAEKVSLIIIPETVTSLDLEDKDRGTITAVGANVCEDLKVGMEVVIDCDQAITIDKESRLFALPEDSVLGVIEYGV